MNRRKINEFIASWGIALLISAAAAFLGIQLRKCVPSFTAWPLVLILFGAFALTCIINRVSAHAFANKHFRMPSAEQRKLHKQHIEACQADPAAAHTRYKGMIISPVFFLCFYFLLSISIVVAGSLCLPLAPVESRVWKFILSLFCWLTGWFLLYMPLYRLFEQIPHRLSKGSLIPLPQLEAIIQKAANTVGIRGRFPIRLSQRYLVRIVPRGKTYVVCFSPQILSVLTEDEVYQILLMGMDHLSRLGTYRLFGNVWTLANLGSARIRRETFAFDLFYSYTHATMEWDFEFCYTAYHCFKNEKALQRVLKDGNPSAAISGWAKIGMWRYFSFEYTDHVPDPYYQDPELHDHHERDVCEAFKTALQKRQEVWKMMLTREIRSEKTRYYPLFCDYLQGLAPDMPMSALELKMPDETTAYGREIMMLTEWYDQRMYAKNVKNYKDDREHEYLYPLRIVEAYEKNPTGYTTPELSPVINAYRDLCRIPEAEAICDRILATEENRFALAHAAYFKGMCRIHRYETEGIDLIYRAIDLNKNYMEDGFTMVEEYCTMCGLGDEYETFLRRAETQMAAHARNHAGAGSLSPTDHLVKEEELGDMLPDILAYMEKVSEGKLKRVYLVRKVISEDFFSSVFVIDFEAGEDGWTPRRAYDAIFNYLDSYPVDWQFSLFVCDPNTMMAVSRVEGSLVWEKKDGDK